MLWLRGRHPAEPATWRADVNEAEKRAARWAAGELKLQPGEEVFDEALWTAHKVTFSRCQCGKCGYCEMFIAADPSGGDMEHYRPKGEVTALGDDPTTWGREVEGHNSRDPNHRRQAPRVSAGYWWLAYEWRNYLLACGTCNQKWKGNLFPRKGAAPGDPTRAGVGAEAPLLLNPYGDEDPARHLAFDQIGLVTPHNNSPHGWETIRTCRLDRETLVRSRFAVAEVAWPAVTLLLKELANQPRRAAKLRRALSGLLKLGACGRQHAGMVRAMWAQRDPYGLSWKQLRDLRDALRVSP